MDVGAIAQCQSRHRQRGGGRGRDSALVERAGSRKACRFDEERFKIPSRRDANFEQGDSAAVVDERVPDARLRAYLVSCARPTGMTADDERHVALDDLPPLGLSGMDVLGNVAAGIRFDLGEQIIAITREAIALVAHWINHYVTHE